MDLPSSAPVGGLVDRAVTGLGLRSSEAALDQAKYLHHAGSPWSLALAALGVVFGDIGTSPLYAFQVALTGLSHSPPVAADVVGVVSLILWALVMMVSLKYVVFILRADNDGEGGILALLSLVAADQVAKGARLPVLVLLGVIGASLLYGDGVITPAISVLSAMEGLKLVTPGFEKFILPATIAVLVGLFMIQRHGTGSIGKLFGPVMVIWFVVIGGLGAINIWMAPAILKAVNPVEAGHFLIADPKVSFVVIGAVFLALTGGEALYADMGHVGATAIRRAWFGLVLPALLLNYFGQGALILADPAASDNPFYKLAPGWALVPMLVLATFATIIASQALVSGVFSLTRQAMQMGLSPRARIIPTSVDEAGQIYVPAANWLLMTGTLLTVALFRSSENLAAAYGIAVSGTMLITTILLYRVAVSRWQWPPGAAIPVIAVFGAIDATFLVSNSIKIVEGGWFPLIVGAVIATLMLSWRKGSSEVRDRLHQMSMPLKQFLDYADKAVIGRAPGLGVWLTKVEHGASPMLLRHIGHNRVLHQTVVLLTFVSDRRPRVPFHERHSLQRLGHGFYQIQVRLGFMQTPDIPLSLLNCNRLGFDADLEHRNYYIAHETIVRREAGSAMDPVSFAIFSFLNRIASRAPDFFKIPHDAVIEVGFRVEI
ncbi:potassium transporter Kup [Bradyrhizobium erythrophlei]|uniref:Probable potassium transport system protein Kup n=1 Tax=Bradyrhizobium erythrophlei TaxID=1437360 RepID=A0A1M5H339_9BRAD|nr:KUP/HAK/KT family potassium transporter [Bradyrhizobium erythrophlei]SHG10318.1 KUP system potassium uptake protein [Bradyrhizobium erythrophlei]